jgi:hypothetical protein
MTSLENRPSDSGLGTLRALEELRRMGVYPIKEDGEFLEESKNQPIQTSEGFLEDLTIPGVLELGQIAIDAAYGRQMKEEFDKS